MESVKMILDVDTGIDDALALLYVLKSNHIRLDGITTVFGNVSVEQATTNTLQVLELVGSPYEIPVAMGAAHPLVREWGGPVSYIHGGNGIGDYTGFPPPKQKAVSEFAPDFIVRKINELPGELTLVFVGRMTNLALALAKDPSIASKVKRLVLMGGALRAPGNVSAVAEANILGDPEAAHRVFESGMPITMVGLDVTMKAILTPADVEKLRKQARKGNEQMVEFVEHMLTFYIAAYEKNNGIHGAAMHDPLAAAVAVDPSLVVMEDHYVMVETRGRLSAGATLADLRHSPTTTNASVCVDVDSERFINHLIEVLAQ
jgi:inosine-uridine nucleoside N-ribohydrolase